MKHHRPAGLSSALTTILALLILAAPAAADVRLPHVIGSHMVLQRDKPLPIWGWADPGENVTVTLATQSAATEAGPKGEWTVELKPLPAGGPHTLTVKANNTITLKDILVGEVWVCSGQSNMEMGMTVIQNAKEEVAKANHPKIRLFQLPRATSGLPQRDIAVNWEVCTPAAVSHGDYGGFSAAGYFFGRKLHKELGVPIGLIDTSWGGTRIEPWTPPEGFAAVPKLRDIVKHIRQADQVYKRAVARTVPAIETWVPKAKAALAADNRVPAPPDWPRHALNHHGRPTGLYNALVHPLVPFAIRGAIWYQGESNRGEHMLYYEKMKALILGWRHVWDQGDFPFYFVQLAPFRYKGDVYALPKMWEAQTEALRIPNTGMAVTVDVVHNIADIHPINKQAVGKRLALWALAKTYGKNLIYSGPLLKNMTVEGGKARITFDHTGGGLTTRDDKAPSHFQIAGEDKEFVDAQAKIDGDSVIVWSDKVSKPVAVRYAWHQEAQPNLINKEGLPASPFRTDRW